MFRVNFLLPWLWIFTRMYHVEVPTWDDACRVADIIESHGFHVSIERR